MYYTEEEFRNIGIHNLRELARDIGVKNPTKEKKKDDLIKDILDITEGRVEPSEPSRKGRPPSSRKKGYPLPQINAPSFLAERSLRAGYGGATARFDAFKPVKPHEKLCEAYGLLKGQRVLIVFPAGADAAKTLKDLTGNLKESAPCTLIIDAPPEDAADFAGTLAGETVISPLGTPPIEHLRTAAYRLSSAKRLVEAGEDSVLVVYSLDTLYRVFYQQDASEALTAAQIFFGAGRKLEEAGSLTLIGFIKDNPGNILFDSLSALANAVIYLKQGGTVDKEKSYTK